MPLPIKARLAPKGTGGNSLIDNLLNRGTEAVADAVSDALGDAISDTIGGGLGGAIGGEIGNFAGLATGELLSTALGSGGGGGNGYFAGPASVLSRTGGLVFPNTPIIQVSHTANWEDYDLTHTNYAYWAYRNSKIDTISVIGRFSVNTRNEADYLLGAIHFLRSVTKMHFGESDPKAGTPPPVLEFSALGPDGFNNVPVIVTNFSDNFEDAYDYVISTNGTYVPTMTIISISMYPYYNPSDMQSEFNLETFKQGGLLQDGWI